MNPILRTSGAEKAWMHFWPEGFGLALPRLLSSSS